MRGAGWAVVGTVWAMAGCAGFPSMDVEHGLGPDGSGVRVSDTGGSEGASVAVGTAAGGGAALGGARGRFVWERVAVPDGGRVVVDHGVVLLLPDALWAPAPGGVQETEGTAGSQEVVQVPEARSMHATGRQEMVSEGPDAGAAGSLRVDGSGAAAQGGTAGLAYRVCEAVLARPEGYAGPDLAKGERLVRHVVDEGESWWLLGRRNALDYASLAALNGLSVMVVENGEGLIRGESVWLVRRTGEGRKGRLRFCAGAQEVASGGESRWMVFPDGGGVVYRPVAEGDALAGGVAPALLDGDARWVYGGWRLSWEEHERRSGVTREALLRFNGVRPEAVAAGAFPRRGGFVAWPG